MSQKFDSLFRQGIQRAHYQADGIDANKSHIHVVIWPTFSGLSEFEKSVADQVASWGFSATALDLYGQGHNPVEIDEKLETMGVLLKDAASLHQLQNELTHSACHDISEKTIIHVGFCLGGRLALEAGLHFSESAGAVSFHGLMGFYRAESPEKANLKARILVLNGYEDRLVTERDAQQAKQYWSSLGMDFQFIDFANTMHSFMLPNANSPENGSQYNPIVAKRGYQYLASFLAAFMDDAVS